MYTTEATRPTGTAVPEPGSPARSTVSTISTGPTRPTGRRTLSSRAGYALSAALVGLFLFASGVPSALYGTYAEVWGFSPLVLTLVYSTYAFGVLTTLLLAG